MQVRCSSRPVSELAKHAVHLNMTMRQQPEARPFDLTASRNEPSLEEPRGFRGELLDHALTWAEVAVWLR